MIPQILLVEADTSIREVLRILMEQDYVCHITAIADILDVRPLLEQGMKFDACFLDLAFRTDEVLRFAYDFRDMCPIFMMSAWGDKYTPREALEFLVIRKPFNLSLMEEVIETICRPRVPK